MPRKVIYTDSSDTTAMIFGPFDCNIEKLEARFDVRIFNKKQESTEGDAVIIEGTSEANVEKAYRAVEFMKTKFGGGEQLGEQTVDYIIGMVADGSEDELAAFDDSCICITNSGKPIKAKTVGQKKYVNAIKKNTVVLGVGPAGTG